jgi:hypothetical protein
MRDIGTDAALFQNGAGSFRSFVWGTARSRQMWQLDIKSLVR